ncbi:hypothetical protein BKA66DRAFT_284009 [Pyrenochaeta sp. MPI-SDFR-AT-0127]|nr:hypothetical protein BKA66DRAFT_284009 [Pyrenochaeta sp. MPI-SDFR-AT-0127]
MLAGSYILACQSAYLPDGIVDNIISLRGCALISQMIKDSHMEGIFSPDPRLHFLERELKLRNFPTLDQELAHNVLGSLARFAHLLYGGREIERAFFAQLVQSVRPLLVPSRRSPPQISTTPDPTAGRSEETVSSSENSPFLAQSPIVHPLFPAASHDNILFGNAKDIADVSINHKVDPRRAFNALISSRIILCTWPQDHVLHLFCPTNRLGAILMVHYFAIRLIVSPLWAPDSVMRTPMKAMIEWFEKVVDSVEDDEQVKWAQYVELPSHILRAMRCCINQKKGLTFGDLYDILIKDPGAYREGRLRRL